MFFCSTPWLLHEMDHTGISEILQTLSRATVLLSELTQSQQPAVPPPVVPTTTVTVPPCPLPPIPTVNSASIRLPTTRITLPLPVPSTTRLAIQLPSTTHLTSTTQRRSLLENFNTPINFQPKNKKSRRQRSDGKTVTKDVVCILNFGDVGDVPRGSARNNWLHVD
jgi:hypothetical protein